MKEKNQNISVADRRILPKNTFFTRGDKSHHKKSAIDQANAFALTDIIKIGNDVYIIERHFSGERDIREAVFAVVKNEAFQAS